MAPGRVSTGACSERTERERLSDCMWAMNGLHRVHAVPGICLGHGVCSRCNHHPSLIPESQRSCMETRCDALGRPTCAADRHGHALQLCHRHLGFRLPGDCPPWVRVVCAQSLLILQHHHCLRRSHMILVGTTARMWKVRLDASQHASKVTGATVEQPDIQCARC